MQPEIEKAEPLAPSMDSQGNSTDPNENRTKEQAVEAAPAPAWPRNDAPDGGTAAWLVVLGAWCTSFCSFGWINSIGEFQQFYELSLLRQYSASTISWIPALQVFFMMAMGPIIGRIYDSHGPRVLIFVGTCLHVFGLMMASISKEYYQVLLAQGVCSAIGVSCIFQPALNCIQGWFNKNRGIAYGVLATGSSVGGIIFPIMVSRLIREVGYGWAMRISALLILFLLVIANLTVRAFTTPNSHKVAPKQLIQPLREPGFVAVMLGVFLFTFGLFCVLTYVTVQAISAGMDPVLAQYLLAMLNAASLFGRLLSGMAADKFGKYNVFIVVCYITGIVVLALWIPASGNAAIITFAILFGFFSGAYVSLIPALVAQISPPKEIGFRTGLVFLLSSFGGLTTGPIAGAILANHGGWLGLKVFAGAFCLAGTTFVLAARFYFTGPKFSVAF